MKTFLCVLVVLAVAKATSNWANIKPKNLYVPVKGLPLFNHGNRIIGGQEAGQNQFPYQVALFIDNMFFCGGSLISRNYVLTAAHCADGANRIEVLLGAHNVRAQEPSQLRVVSYDHSVHAGWSMATLVNDLALVRLPEPVTLTDSIQILALPSRSDANKEFVDVLATVSGWRKNSDSAAGITEDLNYVHVPIITNQECEETFGSYIKATTICASGAGHKSTCNGDSGGPLTVTENGVTKQVGITSFVSGYGCEASLPHAYTRVTKYLDWIEDNSDVTIAP